MSLQDTGVRVWSTSSVAASEAAAYWHEVICNLYVRLSTEPVPGTQFSGEVSHRAYGDFELSVMRASGERVRRTRSLIACDGDKDEYLYATVQTRGRGVLEQAGRLAELTPGSLVFYDTSEPFTVRFEQEWERVVVHVPVAHALASAGLKRSADLVALPLAGGGAAGAAIAFFLSLARVQGNDPAGAELLARHVPGLLAATLILLAARHDAARNASARPVDFVRRERVMAFLRSRLADPGLDADAVARSCYISRRTLYRLFEGVEGSVMGRLRLLRIENAQWVLRHHPDRSVSSVGQQCGFPADAQFHRVFRELTGTTPAAYRAMNQTVS